MPARIVEKDYFITEALRCANRCMPDRLIFKGGRREAFVLGQECQSLESVFLQLHGVGAIVILDVRSCP